MRRSLVVALLLSGVAGAGLNAAPTREAALASRVVSQAPNIVLITTDDQTKAELRWMPKTRRLLGAAGLTFTNGVSPHPLCCPARAEILTGQFAQNNGVHSNEGSFGGYPALRGKRNTLAAWLHDAGYETSLYGKFLNGFDPDLHAIPRGWDHWNSFILNGGGYYRYAMYDGSRVTWHNHNGGYSTTEIADDTVDRINQSTGAQPFFIWSSYFAPHGICGEGECGVPPEPEAAHVGDWPDAVNPARGKPSFNEADVTDKPREIRRQKKKSPREMQRFFQARIEALASVDDAVERTVAALASTGVLENTIIIFTSDNGYLLGEHRYAGKLLGYQEALRVPFLIRGPGVPVGQNRRQVATTVDIAPTIVALAGARAGRLMDGQDLMPYVLDANRKRTSTTLIQAGGNAGKSRTAWWYRGVRTARYTLVHWTYGFTELYDRSRDPFELVNVARRARYAAVRAELEHRLEVLKPCSGTAECQQDFGPLPPLPRR